MQIDIQPIRLLQTTDSHTSLFVNYFHTSQNQYMVFRLSINA